MGEGRRKLVLTRTQQGNDSFIKFLVKQGDNVLYVPNIDHFEGGNILSVPMMEVEFFDLDLEGLPVSEVLLVTSAHASQGVAMYVRRHGSAGQMFAVGHVTALAMRDAGWQGDIKTAATADALAQIMRMEVPYKASLLYLRGQDIAFDFTATEDRKDISFVDKVVYKASLVTEFPPFFEVFLRRGEVGCVAFFSRRAALNFLDILCQSGLLPLIGGIKALCISQSVLESVRESFAGLAYAAKTPDAEGMAALVFQHVLEE